MQLQNPFDARTVAPNQFPDPLPFGDYKVVIVESGPKETNDKTGGMLVLTLRVIEGQYNGREANDRLNLWNANQQASEIAYRRLSAYCHVTGQFNIQDTQQLHNVPFIATIGPQKDNPQYMQVYKLKDIAGNEPGKPTSTPVAAAAPMPPAPTAPPASAWGAPAPAAPQAPAPPAAAWGAPQPAYAQPAPVVPPQAPAPAPAAVWQPPQPGAPPAAPPAQGKMPWER